MMSTANAATGTIIEEAIRRHKTHRAVSGDSTLLQPISWRMLQSIMPANSDASSAKKKTRKSPPQQLSEETWQLIQAAVCIGNAGYSEIAKKFGITPHRIMMRAKRHGWAVPSKIAKRVEALQKSVTERAVCEANRHCNDQAVEIIAQSWAERGEQHRLLAFQLAHNSLKTAAKRGLPIEDWRDADLADKTARRNAGLDSGEGTRISIGMALINQRLDVIAETLPKAPD
jgi:hypothetical protein